MDKLMDMFSSMSGKRLGVVLTLIVCVFFSAIAYSIAHNRVIPDSLAHAVKIENDGKLLNCRAINIHANNVDDPVISFELMAKYEQAAGYKFSSCRHEIDAVT